MCLRGVACVFICVIACVYGACLLVCTCVFVCTLTMYVHVAADHVVAVGVHVARVPGSTITAGLISWLSIIEHGVHCGWCACCDHVTQHVWTACFTQPQ